MYLKALEMVGFKSFADKTKLDFEPGMTAIVGPNGCGKSNVSDAIRWVIGETSAKALRGTKMEDCIFNGTDARKPLGMAEVSLTLADCESALGTDFHEVTVSRRVFRSGEGEYFMNKTPCRLKDIQRMFMDTGIGTTSYSVMEQGRIDQVLSSHPEDRRVIFEEASGITKFKADKKEALRKLEQTEANLLRLSDVIREVKRQIGSLQRQAGKARRYKELRDELRQMDMVTTRERLKALDAKMAETEAEIHQLQQKLAAAQQDVAESEQGNSVLRESLMQTEREIGSVMETVAQAQSKLDHTREMIAMNRRQIEDYRSWAARDAREIEDNRKQLEEKRRLLDQLASQKETEAGELRQAEESLAACQKTLRDHQKQIDETRLQLHRLREESVEQESLSSKLQNQLLEIDARERSAEVQRERLAAEKAQLLRVASGYERRQQEMEKALTQCRQDVVGHEEELGRLEALKRQALDQSHALHQRCADLRSRAAAKQAQIDLLLDEEREAEQFPGGARLLMDAANPLGVDSARVLGALASHLDVEPAYASALEAALRPWLDAVVVTDASAAVAVLNRLEDRKAGAARMIAAPAETGGEMPADGGGPRLLDFVAAPSHLKAALRRLLGDLRVVDSLEGLPTPLPPGTAYVTRSGSILRGDGSAEFWMVESRSSNPLSRKHFLAGVQRELAAIEEEIGRVTTAIERLAADTEGLDKRMEGPRHELERSRRSTAQKEGECDIISREASEAKERLETVGWELQSISRQGETGISERETVIGRIAQIAAQREQIKTDIQALTQALQKIESRHAEIQNELTERTVSVAGLRQKVIHLDSQLDAARTRAAELEGAVQSRTEGIQSYQESINRLSALIQAAESQLESLEQAVRVNGARVEGLKKNREKQSRELESMEAALSEKRAATDELREARSERDLRLTESRMRRQSQVDRITSEHAVTLEEVMQYPEPDWGGQPRPPMEELETKVAELRTKIDAMGPVNLVAIQEYQELEERHTFLTAQEQDLINSKQQLMEMIRKINRTTSEMFQKTFEAVNANFEGMFKRLFNGGTAKLVLVNEEDVLECGIEIIARPPGKRLQNVSLLSGGERTMTAVALLFAIYMIKPSPFCLLDELDAALDDANIGRFVHVLQDFLKHSQFVVITHNRQTIGASNVLYGVTMAEKGVSRIVAMKFKDRHPEAPPPAAPAETPVPEPEPAPA